MVFNAATTEDLIESPTDTTRISIYCHTLTKSLGGSTQHPTRPSAGVQVDLKPIRSRFVEHSRLTSVGGWGLPSSGSKANAPDIYDEAATLATEIRAYIVDAEANDVAAAERGIIPVTTEREQCEDELAIRALPTHRMRYRVPEP